MIITVTPNPSIDRTVTLGGPLTRGGLHRVQSMFDDRWTLGWGLGPMLYRSDDRFAAGHGSCPLVGAPDDVVAAITAFARAGFDGIALSFLNYADELGYFAQEVLPRLEAVGIRGASA